MRFFIKKSQVPASMAAIQRTIAYTVMPPRIPQIPASLTPDPKTMAPKPALDVVVTSAATAGAGLGLGSGEESEVVAQVRNLLACSNEVEVRTRLASWLMQSALDLFQRKAVADRVLYLYRKQNP